MDTRHPDEGTIHAYVERQLPLDEQARVEAHVSSCAECAASLAEARGMIAAASRIVGALDSVPAKVIPARPVRRLPPWLAAAAVMVLAVGVSSVAIQRGLESRRDVATMAADAAGEPQQEVAAESQASPMVAPLGSERGAVRSNATVATGAAPTTSREADELRSSTVTAAPELVRKSGAREEAVALAAPPLPGPPAPSPAAPDFSGADAGTAGGRATGAAVPTGRTAARMQAAAPGDAVALSLRQSEVTITGRVMTENGEPVAGANVLVNEFNVSVDTDAAGRYKLAIPANRLEEWGTIVRARAIGYEPQEQLLRVATGSQTADFELRRDATQLTEVTITGGTTVAVEEPERTIRYEAAPGVIVELREFHAAARIGPARPGTNEYRWSDAAGARRYVLSGPLTVAELKRLAGRLGELRIVR